MNPSQSVLRIRRIATHDEADCCARMMSSSEPWITLGRDYAKSMDVLQQPNRESYLAESAKEIVGFIILNMDGPFAGYLQTVCVAREKRSMGIGPELVRFAEERIFRQSPNVFLCCSSFNPRSRRFYERLGYEKIGELKDYIIRGHSEILMRKTTGPWNDFREAAKQ
ncbi:MAG TPA: GNAT family N-acetyltransferase [Candidatus Methylomirabilis sp.]|nr:GNAT family N-acetyltransferase [Candidatus Methylomirabilis sp.]